MKALLTTTSYQDTPGRHHELLESSGIEIVRDRGPLSEARMLELIETEGPFDAFLNGDDAITAKVIDTALPSLKAICKYGIGLDSIDVAHATEKKLPVLFTPGVNHTTVAEHAVALMIGCAKHFWLHLSKVKAGEWKRQTGCELMGKTIAVLGMGRIGKEVVIRAKAFGMVPIGYDVYWDEDFAKQHGVKRCATAAEALTQADVVSLHMPMTDETSGLINKDSIATMKDGAIIVNTARGGLVVEQDIAEACRSGKLTGYGTDVLSEEPMKAPHPFQEVDNILVTPHVGSRTFESVERQAVRATLNLVNFLKGDADFIQANEF